MREIESNPTTNLPFISPPYFDIPNVLWSKLLHDLLVHLLVFKVVDGGALVLQWRNRSIQEVAIEKYFKLREQRVKVSSVLVDYFSGEIKKQNDALLLPDNTNTGNMEIDLHILTYNIIKIESHSQSQSQSESRQSPTAITSDNSQSNPSYKGRDINDQSLCLSQENALFNIRKLFELPYALTKSEK